MPKIFISYRRADSQYVIDGIHTELCKHFPEKDVFLDVQNIPLGVDFDIYLREQISAHDIVLVIIGNDWADIMKERANQDDDFVRIEIENALQQEKILIPVLVKGAEMPDFSDLPDSIQGMRRKNNISIRRKLDLTGDVKRLADGINEAMNFKLKRGTSVRMKQEAPPQTPVGLTSTSSVTKPKILPHPDESILPDPFEWIHIPASDVTLEAGGYVPEAGQTFTVDDFYIAKYPLTNVQYGVYVAETGKNPDYWDDARFNQPLQPVVGISWHDAIAYCDWLSEKLRYNVSLPTEQQWQLAAQGNDKLIYPWSNRWDSTLCNHDVDEMSIGRTTPVNQYPGGASPFWVMDMSGNVREWCLTDYESGSQDTNNNVVRRVLRGGGWNNFPASFFRCATRSARLSDYSLINFGFRITY